MNWQVIEFFKYNFLGNMMIFVYLKYDVSEYVFIVNQLMVVIYVCCEQVGFIELI